MVLANSDNLCSDYLKRDDQMLAYRLQAEEARNRMAKTAKDRDRALALGKSQEEGEGGADGEAAEDTEETPTEAVGSKVIVVHVGSQNLRIGLASDALPKTVPMVIARKSSVNEWEDGVEPRPKRVKLDGDQNDQKIEPEKQFEQEVVPHFFLLNFWSDRFNAVGLAIYNYVRRAEGAHETEQATNASQLQRNGHQLQ